MIRHKNNNYDHHNDQDNDRDNGDDNEDNIIDISYNCSSSGHFDII